MVTLREKDCMVAVEVSQKSVFELVEFYLKDGLEMAIH